MWCFDASHHHHHQALNVSSCVLFASCQERESEWLVENEHLLRCGERKTLNEGGANASLFELRY